MGYTTKFEGKLTFANELSVAQLAALNEFFGEDCRDHPEWNAPDLCYIDLEISKSMDGIQWSGAEKTYGMVECVNLVIREMRKRFPDFALSGQLLAQGEEIKDRWVLTIGSDGLAHKGAVVPSGKRIKCPHCGGEFSVTKDKK